MTVDEIHECCERHDNEFLKFDRVAKPRSRRPDLHAFLLLDELCPGDSDIVCGAEHDEIHLGVDLEKFAAVATEDVVLELRRCGVLMNDDGLYMFA